MLISAHRGPCLDRAVCHYAARHNENFNVFGSGTFSTVALEANAAPAHVSYSRPADYAATRSESLELFSEVAHRDGRPSGNARSSRKADDPTQ